MTNSDQVLLADEAVARLLATPVAAPRRETVGLGAGLGRVLADDIAADRANPPFDNSAMDGYAVRTADLHASGSTVLPVRLRIAAGDAVGAELPAGAAARIFTGAPLPIGADAVLPQEVCEGADGTVTVPRPKAQGENIRRRGEDFDVGEVVLTAGTKLRPQELGLLSALGLPQVTVFAKPRVAVFSSGAEVRDPGQPLAPGTIYDINRYTVMALLNSIGCEPVDLGILPDDRHAVTAALDGASGNYDALMTSGGVSVGEEDHIKAAVEALGTVDFWRVAIRPGRPLAFGRIGATPFIGLPGNPVSSMVCFLIFARPFLTKLGGGRVGGLPHRQVPAAFDFTKRAGRREWLRGWTEDDGKGGQQVQRFANEGSGNLTSMTQATGLIDLSEDCTTVSKGDLVAFIAFTDLWG